MFWLKACPRCHGDLYWEKDVFGSYVSCLPFGRELSKVEEISLINPFGPMVKIVGEEVEAALIRAA